MANPFYAPDQAIDRQRDIKVVQQESRREKPSRVAIIAIAIVLVLCASAPEFGLTLAMNNRRS